MKAQKINRQAGFTLIETLMAMAIFTIGILSLFGMQTAVIKKNLAANNITSGATWAADRAEQIISMTYNQLTDQNNNGCAGLNDRGNDADQSIINPGNVQPAYNVYYNVAKDCVLFDIPIGQAADESDEQKPKYLRIIVTKVNSNGAETEAAVFNYIKQNSRNQN